VIELAGGKPAPETALGLLSLVIWTLLIVTAIKYVTLVMRANNDGEGGILALMSLLGVKKRHRPGIIALGLFGAALIYGDGAITPAISVLSALEGLKIVTPAMTPLVLPAAVAVLIALFVGQSQGTARIGHTFSPLLTRRPTTPQAAPDPGALQSALTRKGVVQLLGCAQMWR